MLENAHCTIYEKETYVRHEITNIYWNDSRGAIVTRNGVQIQDSIMVYIYEDDYIPKAGDIIVNGLVNFEFDTTSQQTISESMKQLRALHPDFAVVKNVNPCLYGSLPHIELTAR